MSVYVSNDILINYEFYGPKYEYTQIEPAVWPFITFDCFLTINQITSFPSYQMNQIPLKKKKTFLSTHYIQHHTVDNET